MTDQDRNLLHSALLQILRSVGDGGRTEALILTDIRIAGFAQISLPELQSELRGMRDRGWIGMFEPMPGLRRYRITALGGDKATELGL